MYGSVFIYSTQALSTCRHVSSALENGLLLVLWLFISLLFLSFSILEILLIRHWSFISLAFLSCYPSVYLIFSCSDIFFSYLVLTIKSLPLFGPFSYQPVSCCSIFSDLSWNTNRKYPTPFFSNEASPSVCLFLKQICPFYVNDDFKKLTSMWWYW